MKRFLRPVRVFLFVVVWVSAVRVGWSSEPAPAAVQGPAAQFAETEVDFGEVNATEMKRHAFVVTNTGNAPLLITSVSPSCGCTTAGEWDREIAPGESGRIGIEFNPSNFSGPVTKTVMVTTNDRAKPTHVLHLKANVTRPFSVQPAFANFLPVEGEPSNEVRTIRIVHNPDAPVEVSAVRSSDPRFKAELKTLRPGKEFEVNVSYESGASAASPSATITLETSSKDQPTITITAFAMPQPAVVVVPPTLQLPPTPMPQDYQHNIVVRNNGRSPLQVSEPAVLGSGVTVKLTEAQPGKLYYLNVRVPHDFKAPVDGTPVIVTAKTSHPKFPEIRVPIVQAAVRSATRN